MIRSCSKSNASSPRNGERPGRAGLQQALVGKPVAQVLLEVRLELIDRLERMIGRGALALRTDEEFLPEIVERPPLLRPPLRLASVRNRIGDRLALLVDPDVRGLLRAMRLQRADEFIDRARGIRLAVL